MEKSFTNEQGRIIVLNMIKTIQENKQYLSDIDGAIGDGDHGINMNKGFSLCEKQLEAENGDLAFCLNTLSKVLFEDIGGSMGPLYGMFFMEMSKAIEGIKEINSQVFANMLSKGEIAVRDIGSAEVGDKTLMDTLTPSVYVFTEAVNKGIEFDEVLVLMKVAAISGRDSTIDMIAKIGRASRLGERSKGHIDAGATSCCLILVSMADSVISLLK